MSGQVSNKRDVEVGGDSAAADFSSEKDNWGGGNLTKIKF